jgi:hypothetical protein
MLSVVILDVSMLSVTRKHFLKLPFRGRASAVHGVWRSGRAPKFLRQVGIDGEVLGSTPLPSLQRPQPVLGQPTPTH